MNANTEFDAVGVRDARIRILLDCDLPDTMLDVVERDLHRLTETPEVQIAETIYCYRRRD